MPRRYRRAAGTQILTLRGASSAREVPHVVIVGAGFGGLAVVHGLAGVGVRNRLSVALSWLWIYATGRSACLITQGDERPKSRKADH